MSTINAKIIADSVSYGHARITTMLLHYPRFIHSEFLTHRVFSRNAASSRAIPTATMIERLRANPAMPVYWGANQKGMQAKAEISTGDIAVAKEAIIEGMEQMVRLSEKLRALGVHKQTANRYLEPWNHMETLVTSTEWGNFFALRAHPDAQPEFQTLAFAMLRAYTDSTPKIIENEEWHIPFGDRLPDDMPVVEKLKIAVARSARTSYMNFEGVSDHQADIALHDRLVESGHWSPFEHPAKPALFFSGGGNFRGWIPYRKIFPERTENRPMPDAKALLTTAPAFVRKALQW